VGATGFEPPADSTGKTSIAQHGAAFSGAVSGETAHGPDLNVIAAELSKLTPSDRARLAAMLLDTPSDCAAASSAGKPSGKSPEPPEAVESK
jgi:hypothetical protein